MLINYKLKDRQSSYAKLIDFINAAQPEPSNALTESEKNLLIEFLLLPPKYHYFRFSSHAKRVVTQLLEEKYNWTLSRENLNNKIYSMISKGVLRRDADNVIYLSKSVQAIITAMDKALDSHKPYTISLQLHEDSQES